MGQVPLQLSRRIFKGIEKNCVLLRIRNGTREFHICLWQVRKVSLQPLIPCCCFKYRFSLIFFINGWYKIEFMWKYMYMCFSTHTSVQTHVCTQSQVRVSALFTSRSAPWCLNHILSLCFKSTLTGLLQIMKSHTSTQGSFLYCWSINLPMCQLAITVPLLLYKDQVSTQYSRMC